jgi:hypothetical protein
MSTPEATSGGHTRFHVFTCSDDLVTLTRVGTVEARDRHHALRVQFGQNPPLAVAISETAFRPQKPKVVEVVRGTEDAMIPPLPGEQATILTRA